ncbi:hypothetical protein A3H80_02030 [Candidatus Roizmanbacteria bacterium RIFCSPLOWO2_02_FULL_37_19]|uniref:DUF378 domain-containing protein n=1 Tax=Candidatus Roizmanbacteria bacterium RIFCSPHIGHO2_02_FULL_37_24 TaxID=1802037 RepID=A0A1F7H0E4_9BACT|nr:MAG: hypothetical protein A2862_02615 [Candidatus Roizmanbacteria bacterium RIFCSPHIGHO2_01_FULL_38_41]OGK24513.1 MAG: hypothetical protein A3C24_03110 [Candidatus Roizmanbacteria bacterium RIFCSPHIGHO2_02_FULL_37_24]OGK31967.1 MAG: hypothetical protein A3E10_04450 [Candidatus Roizmanbacteria bacterium RIFCSPHIGHO2_12_FULL_37_23]OGK43768.1 MAG: hypothetical protein A2956_04575 [Candidatus Roizmanbacteria bacterium RIFCSPLOWO2_01_FULL_37_57]OGK54322.1 MAG: hypothetical protein A3H80_02030 [Ca
MKDLQKFTFWLMVIGALNWGLVGLLDLNLVEMLLGTWPVLVQVVYILVGLSAVVEAVNHPSMRGKGK